MRHLLAVPADAAWPTAMTPLHPDAAGSHGLQATQWAKDELGLTLRWWQELALTRQLEHDAEGRLVWQNVIESTPRRAGKSVRLRVSALWRLAHADLFGEQQLVLHTGKDNPIAKEIHRRAWPYAESQRWIVRHATGHEEIETETGDRWMVRGRSSVYGYDVTLGMVDEAWGVDAGVVDEGLEPAMLERVQPQLVLTSTAHRRATSLMKRRFAAALAGLHEQESETLLLWWGADLADDINDPATWRRASPHWSEERRKMIAGKLDRAVRGEADSDADDLDPVEGFRAQYLNIWPSDATARPAPGKPVTTETEWQALEDTSPAVPPDTVGVESWFGQGVIVASARRASDRVHVSVQPFTDVASAARYAEASLAPAIIVGKSLLTDPAFATLAVTPKGGTSSQAVQELRRLMDEDVLRHDGSEELTAQVLAIRTNPSADGLRVRSSGRMDAVKALCWSVEAARAVSEQPAIY